MEKKINLDYAYFQTNILIEFILFKKILIFKNKY